MAETKQPRTRREKYGSASVSGRLKFIDNMQTDLDTVAAAGMAGVKAPLGLAMWRAKYANDRHAYRHAQALLIAKAANTARRRHWKEPPKVIKLLAVKVFTWSVFGVCPVCQGRGHLPLDMLPNVLDDDPCPACHGDGVTPIEKAVPVHHIGRAKDILQLIADADGHIDARMWARLSGRVADIKG